MTVSHGTTRVRGTWSSSWFSWPDGATRSAEGPGPVAQCSCSDRSRPDSAFPPALGGASDMCGHRWRAVLWSGVSSGAAAFLALDPERSNGEAGLALVRGTGEHVDEGDVADRTRQRVRAGFAVRVGEFLVQVPALEDFFVPGIGGLRGRAGRPGRARRRRGRWTRRWCNASRGHSLSSNDNRKLPIVSGVALPRRSDILVSTGQRLYGRVRRAVSLLPREYQAFLCHPPRESDAGTVRGRRSPAPGTASTAPRRALGHSTGGSMASRRRRSGSGSSLRDPSAPPTADGCCHSRRGPEPIFGV
ncbi:hypothetical protein H4W80_004924 [Nonomuraea angiospora]|uniref:Uncharacterized protein n=1 Tax=Nonomuraea angiospora TaxID=46172 RepID=A0ABR9M193_9ACTN|nr:hypothetical protein [Nonomuraea angiospora]